MIGSSQDQKCSSQIAFDNLFQSVYRGQVLQMVYESVVFGLGKFYGTSLPRCRIYIDVKCNDRLVDPQFASPSTLPHIVHEDTADLNVGGVSNRSGRRQHARQIWTLTM
ncbi:hypothetical protein JHK87_039307 [Glycine soja]|nr:hypothetical protein JHK87_039307 [Glycine soja]